MGKSVRQAIAKHLITGARNMMTLQMSQEVVTVVSAGGIVVDELKLLSLAIVQAVAIAIGESVAGVSLVSAGRLAMAERMAMLLSKSPISRAVLFQFH
jgi:hypothetical protein